MVLVCQLVVCYVLCSFPVFCFSVQSSPVKLDLCLV